MLKVKVAGFTKIYIYLKNDSKIYFSDILVFCFQRLCQVSLHYVEKCKIFFTGLFLESMWHLNNKYQNRAIRPHLKNMQIILIKIKKKKLDSTSLSIHILFQWLAKLTEQKSISIQQSLEQF